MGAIAHRLLKIFGSRRDVYAVAQYDGTNVAYITTRQELTEEDVERHLTGSIVIGTYQLAADDTVRWLGWDIDSPNLTEAKEATRRLLALIEDCPHCVEFSGSKGYHPLIFLDEPMAAEQAKSVVDGLRTAAGIPSRSTAESPTHCECFPKQARLTPSNPLGNLLKMPLGQHPRTHEWSKFVDPENGWESGPTVAPLPVLENTATHQQVLRLMRGYTAEERLAQLLAPWWQPGNRHEMALALSGTLANLGWSLEQTVDLIEQVCNITDDAETNNRLAAVRDTYRRQANHQPIIGYSGLAALLPGNLMRQLVSIGGTIGAEPGVRQVDDLRLGRGVGFRKVRNVEHLIWSETCDLGRWVKTVRQVYWWDSESHELFEANLRGIGPEDRLLQMLHERYGINTAESFGRQVYHGLLLKAANEAPLTNVYHRSHWDGKQLFVCPGGPEVYMISRDGIQLSYNGVCGHLFHTRLEPAVQLPVPEHEWMTHDHGVLKEATGKAWDLLVNDLSLVRSETAPARPEQQRALLQAWILSTFFPEMMPTKPLLLALGSPGSGKTTAMRRIVQVLEGWESDVTEIATDKQDALRTSIIHHSLLVLDNLEQTKARWLPDMLNRASTGTAIELRQLYKTATLVKFKPVCFIAMTAVDIPFSHETVFDRMLPMEFQRIKQPTSEAQLRSLLLQDYHLVWLDLLQMLQAIVQTAKTFLPRPLPPNFRMADYGVFCQLIVAATKLQSQRNQQPILVAEDLVDGLRSFTARQRAALMQASAFVDALDIWVINNPEIAAQPHRASQLLAVLQGIARTFKDVRWRWSNPGSLTRHILTLREQLEKAYGLEIEEVLDPTTRRTVKLFRFKIQEVLKL